MVCWKSGLSHWEDTRYNQAQTDDFIKHVNFTSNITWPAVQAYGSGATCDETHLYITAAIRGTRELYITQQNHTKNEEWSAWHIIMLICKSEIDVLRVIRTTERKRQHTNEWSLTTEARNKEYNRYYTQRLRPYAPTWRQGTSEVKTLNVSQAIALTDNYLSSWTICTFPAFPFHGFGTSSVFRSTYY